MMTTGSAFSKLGISLTDDIRAIRKAYASKCRECHPEDNPVKWQELQEAYSIAVSYAQNRVIPESENTWHADELMRSVVGVKSQKIRENTIQNEASDNDVNKLFEELGAETDGAVEAATQLEEHIANYQNKIKSIIYPFRALASSAYWPYEKKLIQYHETTVQLLGEDSYGGFSDDIKAKAVNSITYVPSPWKPSFRYRRRMVKTIKLLLRILEQQGIYEYSDALSKLAEDYYFFRKKTRGKYIKSLAINALIVVWLSVITFYGTRKIEVPDYAMHYEQYEENLPDETPVSVNINSAAISGYYEKYDSERNPVGKGSYKTVSGQTVLRAQSDDGQIVYIVFEKTDIMGNYLSGAVSDTAVEIAKTLHDSDGTGAGETVVNVKGTIERAALTGYVPAPWYQIGSGSIRDYMYDAGTSEDAQAALHDAMNGAKIPAHMISLDALHNYEVSPDNYYIRYKLGLPKEGETIYKTVTERGYRYECLPFFIIGVLCLLWKILSVSKRIGIVRIID